MGGDRGFLYFAIAFGIILVLWGLYLWRDFYSSKAKRKGLSIEDKAAALVLGENEGDQAGIIEIRRRHPELTINDCKAIYYKLVEDRAHEKHRARRPLPGTGVFERANDERLRRENQKRARKRGEHS